MFQRNKITSATDPQPYHGRNYICKINVNLRDGTHLNAAPAIIKEIKMSCGCGRSPTGKCIGWHKLDEDQYLEKKAAWAAKQAAKDGAS